MVKLFIIGAIVVSLALFAQDATSPSPASGPTIPLPGLPDMSSGQWVILGTIILGIVREAMHRRWERQDRDAKAAALEQRVKETAIAIASEVQTRSDKLDRKLDANTEISAKAFSEANNVNNKIADIQSRFDELLQSSGAATAVQQDRIESTVKDTNERVRDIEESEKGA